MSPPAPTPVPPGAQTPAAPALPAPPTAVARPPRPKLHLLLAKTLSHALVYDLGMLALTPLLRRRPLGEMIVDLTQPGWYLPFAVGLSAAITGDALCLIITVVIMAIWNYPNDLIEPFLALGIGAVLGAAIRGFVRSYYEP